MQKENVSLAQLITLIFTFLQGSAMIMGVGTELRQDVWIGVLIATGLGTGLMYFYYTLNKLLPNKNLFEMLEHAFTRPGAVVITIFYIIYFLYISSRLNRDFAELISTSVLPLTPIEVIILAIVLVIVYILYLGLEVLARVSEVFFPYLILFLFLIIIFLLASGRINFLNALPMFGDGFMPIIKGIFPGIITFPFGELIVFTVVLSSISQFQKAKKASLVAVFIAGLFLTFASFIVLVSLGPDLMEFAQFPLLSVARKISVANFIERTDAFVVFIMMLGVLVKSALFLYAGLKGLEYIFRIPYRNFTFPIGMVVSCFSIWVAENFAEHVEEGLIFVTKYLHPPLQFAIPLLLFGTIVWKNKRNQPAEKNSIG